MSLEAIKKITDTERAYQQKKEEAAVAAQKLVADAEKEGKKRLERAKTQAETQAHGMLEEAEKEAAERAKSLMKAAEIRCEGLQKEAEKQLEKVVDIIVERIVNDEWLS